MPEGVDPLNRHRDLHLGLGQPWGVSGVAEGLSWAAASGFNGALVPPAWLPAKDTDLPEGLFVTALCGYPSGSHHILIKASEARLAVQYGCPGVLVMADPASIARGDGNALIAEIVALREAVSDQISLSIGIDAAIAAEDDLTALTDAARVAGAQALTVMGGRADGVPTMVKKLAGTGLLPVTVAAADIHRGSPGDPDELIAAGARVVALDQDRSKTTS